VRWDEFAVACPDLAEIARGRLDERHLALVGTLRADGSPRITPVEPYLADGELMVGMMWQSRKALDLLRDPRYVLHSIVTDWEATEGDVKVYGNAEPVPIGPRREALYRSMERAHGWPEDHTHDLDPDYHVFALDIDRVGYVRFLESTWIAWSWTPRRGLAQQERPKD
jgi:hypothetical protein